MTIHERTFGYHICLLKKCGQILARELRKRKFHTIIELAIVELSDKFHYLSKFYMRIIQTQQQASE